MPIIVLEPAQLDVLARHAHLPPQVDGLVVAVQRGDPHGVGIEPETPVTLVGGDQFPRQLDRALLEVVAEREVAEHLEERAVPGGLADLVDVERADALLHAHRPLPGSGLGTGEVRLERHHAGVDEQQRRVVVKQGGAGHDGMAVAFEELHIRARDVGGLHLVHSIGLGSAGRARRRRSSSRRAHAPEAIDLDIDNARHRRAGNWQQAASLRGPDNAPHRGSRGTAASHTGTPGAPLPPAMRAPLVSMTGVDGRRLHDQPRPAGVAVHRSQLVAALLREPGHRPGSRPHLLQRPVAVPGVAGARVAARCLRQRPGDDPHPARTAPTVHAGQRHLADRTDHHQRWSTLAARGSP